MKILITGGAGFIGSHLAEWLHAQGHEIIVLDNLSTGERANIASLDGGARFDFIEADGITYPGLGALAERVDAVIHLAAAVGVQKIIDEPVATLETNIDFTQSILRACAPAKTRVLIASTSEVYGRSERALFSESDDLLIGPPTSRRWGYAASKLVDEFLALAWHHEAGLPVTIMRLFNTVGPRQTGRYGMVIPRFIDAAISGEALTVYGDGQQCRTFTAVQQSVRAISELIDNDASIGRIVNIGGAAETSIEALADRIIALCGSSSGKRFVSYADAFEDDFEDMRRRNPDTSVLKELIGWAPDADLEMILNTVIADKAART